MEEKVNPQAKSQTPTNEGRKYVYDKLKEQGYNVGSYGEFDTAMSSDEDSRRWAYDELGKSGVDLGEYAEFEAGIGYTPAPKKPRQKHSIEEATTPKLGFPKLDSRMRMVDETKTPLLKTEQYLTQAGVQEDGTPIYDTKQRAELVPDFDPQNGGVTAPPAYLDVRTGKTIKAKDKSPEVQRAKEEAKRKPEQITDVERTTRDSVARLDADIDSEMSQAMDRIAKENAEKAKDTKNLVGMGLAAAAGSMPGGAGMAVAANPFDPDRDAELSVLKEAKRRLKGARNIIAEADHNAQSGTLGKWLESSFAGGAARGFGQKLFDARTWDFGLGELAGNTVIKSTIDKADSGKSLTKAEMMLLDALSVEMATNAYFGSYVGHGYNAGAQMAENMPFILEFALNPLSTTGSSVASKLARYAVKRYGLKVAKSVGQKALRVGARAVGDAVGSLGMTLTTGAMHTAADTIDRTTGDVHFGLDDNNRIVYDGHEQGDDLGTAIYKAVASRTIENYSEMFGNYFGPLLGGAGRILGKGASKIPYLRRATEFIGKVSGSQFGRMVDDLMTKTQWQGAPSEYVEEVAGNVMNALLVGDKDFSTDKGKGVFNLDDNIDTFLGVSLMSGAISMAKTVGYRTPTMEARKLMERSEKKALSAFGDPVRWGGIRNAIESGDDTEVHNAVAGVLRDKTATEEQKKAVLDYAQRAQTYRGMEEAKRNRLTESGDDATAAGMQASYENGYTLATPQQMSDAKNNLDYLEYKASSDLGISRDELSALSSEGDIDGAYVQGLRDRGYSDQQIGSVLDWFNAKATYDGMIQHAKDDIADQTQAIHDDIDANTAKDGTLRGATIEDGEGEKRVYIVDGNVSMLEDGSGVDKAKSDDNIIIRDPETGEVRFVHLSSIISADEVRDPEVEKARLSDEAKESIAGHFADQIEGKLPLAVGDVYSFATEAGEPYQVSILQDNGDGTMQVEVNGEQIQMSGEELQAQADLTSQVRVRQYHEEEAQRQAELLDQERADEGKLPYQLNDQIIVRTPDGGETIGYIQAEEDEDGHIEVWTDSPINGRRVQLFSRDELDGMIVQHTPAETTAPAEATEEAITGGMEDMDVAQEPEETIAEEVYPEPEGEMLEPEQVPEEEVVAQEPTLADNTVLGSIPLDENGEPAYESVPVSTSYDALMEQTEGDADMVDRVIDSVLSDKRAELKNVEASKVKHGSSVSDKIRAEREREARLEKARGDVAYWEQMKGEREERRIKESQNIDESASVEVGEAPEYHMDNGARSESGGHGGSGETSSGEPAEGEERTTERRGGAEEPSEEVAEATEEPAQNEVEGSEVSASEEEAEQPIDNTEVEEEAVPEEVETSPEGIVSEKEIVAENTETSEAEPEEEATDTIEDPSPSTADAKEEYDKIRIDQVLGDKFTIMKDYHEKNDTTIWVVRHNGGYVDYKVFSKWMSYAKKHWNGYYSKYNGTNGFIFESLKDAKEFATYTMEEASPKDSSEEDKALVSESVGKTFQKKKNRDAQYDILAVDPDAGMAKVTSRSEEDGETITAEYRVDRIAENIREGRWVETEQPESEEPTTEAQAEVDNIETEGQNDGTEEVHIPASTSTGEREGGQEHRPSETLGEGSEHESTRTDDVGVDRRDEQHSTTDEGGSGGATSGTSEQGTAGVTSSETNWRDEFDTDSLPSSSIERARANIEAIRLSKEIENEGRGATLEEMKVLHRYSGWGGAWPTGAMLSQLESILTPEELSQAEMSRNSAYFTPSYVVDAMWDVARAVGFKGGRVLEGSAGIGNILGRMPSDLAGVSSIDAVEVDGATGRILSQLYPKADVHIDGFEHVSIPARSVDLAITNVPFVTGLRVYDDSGDIDLSKRFNNIHDFCIAKNVRKLKEGGVGVFISSSGTLDNSLELRKWLVSAKGGDSDVVGAFRLNNATFSGTMATSDIIVVRKRVGGIPSDHAIDVGDIVATREASYYGDGDKPKMLRMTYNRYFAEHPENMGGKMMFAFENGDTYRPETKSLYPDREISQPVRLSNWLDSVKAKDFSVPPSNAEAIGKDEAREAKKSPTTSSVAKEGSIGVNENGEVTLVQYGLEEVIGDDKKVKGKSKAELVKSYLRIKDALSELLRYEEAESNDDGLSDRLLSLNEAYDSFVDTFGHLQNNRAISLLSKDVDFPSIQAIELYENIGDEKGERKDVYTKTDIFNKRVVSSPAIAKPQTIHEALAQSISGMSSVNVRFIAEGLGVSEDEARAQLLSEGLVFEDPITGDVVVHFEYTSGNVRDKLKQARANNSDGRYDSNISALEKVLPEDIPAHLIYLTLGSDFIPTELYSEFTKEKTGVSVTFSHASGKWMMSINGGSMTEQNRSMGVRSLSTGVSRLGTDIILSAFTFKNKEFSKTAGKETITDKEATIAYAQKVEDIRAEFNDWMRSKMEADEELREKIATAYNETVNSFVPMKIPDEYTTAKFQGATDSVTLNPHQAKAAIRATIEPVLLAHEVGTGKTFTLITSAMEMRRRGTAQKPLIVVQNATLGQFVSSAKRLYPASKILMPTESGKEGRLRFFAQIKYNDWDMVIIPQSMLSFIPDSAERKSAFIQAKIEEKVHQLTAMREARADNRDISYVKREIDKLSSEIALISGKVDTKQLAKSKQNADVRAREMLERKTDETYNFDALGIDAILVDEAHEYKRLGFSTEFARGVKGVDTAYSAKSQGLYLKVKSVLERSGGRNVVFATGTPVSNTAAEVWTFMKYLMSPEDMRGYGIEYFDDFVRKFGDVRDMMEFTTAGKYKETRRFSGYKNLPELLRVWSQVADTVLSRDFEELNKEIPKIEGGGAKDVYLPQSPALRSIMKAVKSELERYDKMSGAEKKENAALPLRMYGIAKAGAIDPRLVLDSAPDDPNSKTNETVRAALRSLEESKSYKGAVAIFSDMFRNTRTGFNLHEEIARKLIDAGVPESQIAVIRSGMSTDKKLDIFSKVNRGEIRVVIGSTFTLGTGVNIQERLRTLIHIDAPNRPMDYTQRNGRILRQGNLHKVWDKPVEIIRFGVEDSLDVTAYQRLKTKGAIADSVMQGNSRLSNSMEGREIEEEEDSFGDMVANLSGSEYALLKNKAEKDLRKLVAKRSQWEADQRYISMELPKRKATLAVAQSMKAEVEAGEKVLAKAFPDGVITDIVVNGVHYASLEDLGDIVKKHNSSISEASDIVKQSVIDASQRRSLKIEINGVEFIIHTDIGKELRTVGSTIEIKSTRTMKYTAVALGLRDVPVQRGLLSNALKDIEENVVTGKFSGMLLSSASELITRTTKAIEQMEARASDTFAEEEELEQSKKRVEEYEALMQNELAVKEAKYAKIDAEVEGADILQMSAEEDTETSEEDDDLRYRYTEQEDLDMQDLDELANSTAEALGESVRIIHDTSEIEGRNESETSRMRGAKGWYDPKTGQVVVVLPNHTDKEDVARTVLHEVVGHKGIRAVVGNRSFEVFLDKVYKGATPEVRKEIIERSKQYGWNVRISTEEYIAELSERGFADREDQGMWNKTKEAFRDLISRIKLSLGFDIGDRELRYMLWRSWQMQQKGGIIGEAENISKQMELGVGNFGSEDNSRYRRGTYVPPTQGDGSLKESYDNLIASSRYQMAEAVQDSMKSVSDVYKMILEKEGNPVDIEEVDGYENAYLGENRLSSVNQAEMEYFSHQVLKPFLDEVGRIVKSGSSYGEVTDYMMSMHGLERNRSMAFDRAVKALAKDQDDATLEDRIHREYLEDGDRIANEDAFESRRISAYAYHKEDDRIRRSYVGAPYDEYRQMDYAGLTGMDSIYEDVEDAEQGALDRIREFEKKHDVSLLWKTKRGVTDATRGKLYETGMISKETDAKLRDMYRYYIPLRGFADGTSEDHYGYLGEARGSFAPAMKRAKGRKSQADDPIAQMSKMFESAVVQGNRNKLVKQKMLNFVMNHPSELFSISDLWLHYNDVTEEWEPVYPEPLPEGASHEEVEDHMREFEERMIAAKEAKPSEYKRGAEARSIPYRVLESDLNEHQMIVKRGGRSIVVTINGNPRFAQAINGMSNPDSNMGGWVGAIFELGSKVNRVLSALYTTKNPDFLMSNIIRDMLYSNTMVWVKESPSYARRFHANIAKYNPVVLRRLLKKHKAGTLNLEDATERHFYQFMMNGGETGYTQQRDIEGHKNEIQRALVGSSGRLTAKKAFMLLGRLGEDLNRAVENVARFSAYVASRDEGRSIDRSIYDAKEISVNFNKKGAGSKFYNAYGQTFLGKSGALISGAGRSFYVFWNAAVQGLSNYGRAVGKNPYKGMIHAASFFTLGVVIPLMAYVNGSGDGDDDYWDLPEYVRRSNICFNAGDGTWVTIPLPQEMRAVYGLGELAVSTISGKEHRDNIELTKAIVEQVTQVLPLDLMEGGGSLRALYPSFVKPLVEASDNVSWTGSPIYKDTPYNKSDPEWTKAYKTANSSLVWLSKTLNELTGGDDYKSGMVDINPAQVEYILKGYFGGAWSFANKLAKSGEMIVGDRSFEWNSIPLANRVVKTSDERTKFRNINNEYYKYKKEAEDVKKLERKYEKSDNVLEYAKKIDELQKDIQYRRYLAFEDLNEEVELLQSAMKSEDDPVKLEELTKELREAKKALVDSIRNIK